MNTNTQTRMDTYTHTHPPTLTHARMHSDKQAGPLTPAAPRAATGSLEPPPHDRRYGAAPLLQPPAAAAQPSESRAPPAEVVEVL